MKVNNICSLEEKLWQSKTELKSRGITLLTKLHIVKAMIYPVVMYRCESWIIKKAESESRSAISNTLQLHWLYSPWNSLGQNTGWVAFPFSRGSSQPRDWTQVSCMAGGFFTNWAIREALSTKELMFQTLVLVKTLESPLDSKEIKSVNPTQSRKSTLNIHWKDWCWSWSCNTLATWCEEPTYWKRTWCWERLKAEGDNRGWDGWMASPTNGHEFE